MNHSWKLLFLLIVICLLIQGFFSMLEMASVSFNRVRLQYYVSKGDRRAIWLNDLLQNSGRLFGTVLICANLAMQVGSEASRRFYESLNLNPDLAPLTQVVLVLVFAEISPLFAGLRHAEHAAMMGVPVLYGISFILRPVIFLFDSFCRIIHRFIGSSEKVDSYLNREELQKILEEKDEEGFNTAAKKIFALCNMTAKNLMRPFKNIKSVSSKSTIFDLRLLLESEYSPFVSVYQNNKKNIIGIVYPRDLLRVADNKSVNDHVRMPWFITESDSITAILRQFRLNNQSVAIVLDEGGDPQGVLTLDEIIDEIFGLSDGEVLMGSLSTKPSRVIVDRTFPGDMQIVEFAKTYCIDFDPQGSETLEELVTHLLGHSPSVGEMVRIDHFEFKVEEASLLGGAKLIAIRTLH